MVQGKYYCWTYKLLLEMKKGRKKTKLRQHISWGVEGQDELWDVMLLACVRHLTSLKTCRIKARHVHMIRAHRTVLRAENNLAREHFCSQMCSHDSGLQ